MYKLNILPIAKEDMLNIITYISDKLNNKTAASNITKNFMNGIDSILMFPYGNPIYMSAKSLKREYRHEIINNYYMFYVIDESEKTITIVRVLYKKMDIMDLIK